MTIPSESGDDDGKSRGPEEQGQEIDSAEKLTECNGPRLVIDQAPIEGEEPK